MGLRRLPEQRMMDNGSYTPDLFWSRLFFLNAVIASAIAAAASVSWAVLPGLRPGPTWPLAVALIAFCWFVFCLHEAGLGRVLFPPEDG